MAMADQINYYEVLGVPREASQDEIRSAYRHLAKERHPDHPSGSAQEFSLLQEAHAVLSDPSRRRTHDEALDLAHAADQLAGLDFGSIEDELSARRQERESGGPGLGERLRGRFGRKDKAAGGGGGSGAARRRGRYEVREARWYEPHNFEPEPVTWKTGAISFVAAFLAFIVAGQLGLWATGVASAGSLAWITGFAPFLPILYTLIGLVAAYFAYRAAGYAGLALVFVAALVVGGQGPPQGLLQFGTLGILLLLVVIWLGNRRNRAARS
jgi:molecular chaperone DnaJ